MPAIARSLVLAVGCLLALDLPAIAHPEGEGDPYEVTIDVRPWIEALRSDDLFQIDPAIDSLASLGDHGVPAIHAALKTENETARINLVEVLGDIRSPATVPPLITAAGDPSAEVRRDAITVLGRLGDERARPVLEAALDDTDSSVRHAAARGCLALCSSPTALRRLVELSIDRKAGASARTSLQRVATANPSLRPRIREIVDEIAVPVMNDSGSSQKYAAALTVAQTGNDDAVPVLGQCAEDRVHPMIAVFCVQALGRLADAAAIETLAALAKGGDERIARPAACKELAKLARTHPAAKEVHSACAAGGSPEKR